MRASLFSRFILLLALGSIMVAVFAYVLLLREPREQTKIIQSFDACIEAEYFVIDTYPRQCQTPEGAVFFEESSMTQQNVMRQATPVSNGASDVPAESEHATTASVSGRVREIDTTDLAFDGPVRILIETERGEELVTIPSISLPLCVAHDAIVSYEEIEPGDLITVVGARGSDGAITPCNAPEHLLRIQ